MVTRRQERVSDRIHEEISDLLQKEIRDPRLAYVTVTGVKVSSDLRLATVFVTALGDLEARDNALAALEHASAYIRRELAQRLNMRITPAVRFLPDDSWERGARVDALLNKIRSHEPREMAEDGEEYQSGEMDCSDPQNGG